MKDLVTIIVLERQTLLRGLTISFLLVLPFTFLPVIVENGLILHVLAQRIPESILYSFGFAVLAVMSSLLHNYNGLLNRKKIFDRPAFKELDFYGRLSGLGSVYSELETFLLGRVDTYYFRLNLINPHLEQFEVEIIPLIDLKHDEGSKEALIKNHGFSKGIALSLQLKISLVELEDKNIMMDKLKYIEKLLIRLGVKPLEVNKNDL